VTGYYSGQFIIVAKIASHSQVRSKLVASHSQVRSKLVATNIETSLETFLQTSLETARVVARFFRAIGGDATPLGVKVSNFSSTIVRDRSWTWTCQKEFT
jgi:hypothetical protein